mgnify:CR=1 FL=1
MLKVLLKKQMLEIFQVYFYDAKKNKARTKVSIALHFLLFFLLVFGLLGGIFSFLATKLCTPMLTADMDWLYFALMGLISAFLGTFGSIFNTYAELYLPKDNDMLISMPISPSTLVVARLAGVYLIGLLYSAIAIVPAVLVYWASTDITLPTILGGLDLILLISIFVLTISCALGLVVAKISQRLKHKSLITVLVSLLFISLYYFANFKAQQLIQDLLANATLYGTRIKKTAYIVYLFGRIGIGDIKASLIISALVAMLFGLMWVLLSHSFFQLATSTQNGECRKTLKLRNNKKSIDMALLGKELSQFFASPIYMLNCALGTFLMPVCAIVVLLKGHKLFNILDEMFIEIPDSVPLLLCVFLCALASMNFMTAPSISLEGKKLWLLLSLPVEPRKIFHAKINMQLILTILPLLICIACTAAIYPMHPLKALMILFFAGSYSLLMALIGLSLGVKMPTLTWTNEVLPIKHGRPVIIILFGGIGYTILLFAGFMILPGWMLGFCKYIGCFLFANLSLSACAYLWLRGKGIACFSVL